MSFPFREKFNVLENDKLKLEVILKQDGNEQELPFYWYQIYRKPDMTPVGKVSIRIGENYHSYYNGNIGYEIDPEYRGHHLSCEAAKLVLEVARFHGMDHVILTCDEDNAPSYKTIERLGAELLEITEVPEDYFGYRPGMPKQRIYRLSII